jgi:hypothetical protein
MRDMNLLHYLTLSLTLAICISNSSAQTSKVAIISLADTTIVHQHVGSTLFSNFTDTLHLDVAVTQHLKQQLSKYLSQKYDVSMVGQLPDSVLSPSEKIFSNWGGLKKEVKKWLTDRYDFVIFIRNRTIPRETNMIMPDNTSGLYTRGRTIGFYTTITFLAYRTSNFQKLEYYDIGGKFLMPVKNLKLPEDKRTFTPEMQVIIEDGFKKYLDSRVEYFLTKTYLVPQNQIDRINANT